MKEVLIGTWAWGFRKRRWKLYCKLFRGKTITSVASSAQKKYK